LNGASAFHAARPSHWHSRSVNLRQLVFLIETATVQIKSRRGRIPGEPLRYLSAILANRVSGFWNDELDSVLQNLGVKTLKLNGTNNDRCLFAS
jgi:hypothetical protein